MSTTYLASAALAQLHQAQAEVDRQVASDATGRCLTCGREEPCVSRGSANATYAKYGRLPVRRPGLASRGIAVADAFGWFAGSTAGADGD
jgi:hypothetical protein